MEIITYSLIAFYDIALLYITIYCLMQTHLLYYYHKKNGKARPNLKPLNGDAALPFVTIQLPIYNEQYVVERLIDNIVKLDYPKDRFEIHVLDDSTDETVEITRKKVSEYQSKGFNIQQVQREVREGYKAGALRDGMPFAKGDFIAIFDADFLPNPDFLRRTLPYFENEKTGVVQTRWEHINKEYSLLTRLQAMQLDVHFTVEQHGRYAGDCLLQFNGTGGVWRRETIDDAGGWEADTLTEDLDLSYRAQLKGWEIVFLEKVGAPAELPAEMNGLKSQQFRWTKGGAETAKKMLPLIWKSPILLRKKIHGTVHLMSSSVFICIFLVAILSVPMMFVLERVPLDLSYAFVFYLAVIAMSCVYYFANVHALREGQSYLRTLVKFIFLFPVFLSLSMGLSLHNTIAVLQGYIGKKTAFIRTPKFNINNLKDSFKNRTYLARSISWTTIMEGILSLYFLVAIIFQIMYIESRPFIVFHLMLFAGFGSICYYSIKHLNVGETK